jgi:hypothetical protein
LAAQILRPVGGHPLLPSINKCPPAGKEKRFFNFGFDGGGQKREKEGAVKIKRWLAWLFLGLLLFSEAGFFVANQQRSTARTSLRAARLEISQLRDQLDEYENSSAVIRSNELVRVRKQNEMLAQSLALAQNSLSQLRATNRLLSQQLDLAGNYLQQQQGQLEQFAIENERARVAAQAALVGQQARTEAQISAAQRNTCINNLRQIDAAKNQWALENNKTAADLPTLNDITPYLKDGIFPACPAGGLYSINAVGEVPTCSVPGHVLP